MSLLFAVVSASRRRSVHHRLALDALRRLRGPHAEAWRNLLLHHHAEYLDGAEAPDVVFKDFKNHVLHVRDKDWGGAIEACQEWYRRSVRALQARDWKQAAWSAGVLSHYYVDPLQPFHTHQTEEENVIHSAVELSCVRTYPALRARLERELGGYPEIKAPSGEKWLAQMVRDGAKAANAHYELVVEHYNFDAGVKTPRLGFDQDLRDAFAMLIGHAVAGLACILSRAFEEAAVRPPRRNGALQALWLSAALPVREAIETGRDAAARRLVQAQYEEYRRTGKVRGTLAEGDKVVRALYAAEVLKTPLSSLDAKWPREIGAKHGEGAPERRCGKAKPQPIVAPVQPSAEADAPVKPDKPDTPRKQPRAAKPAERRELPPGAPLPKREKILPRFMLTGGAPVVQVPSIGPKAARRLEAAGVKTVADLLALRPEDGESRIDASAQLIRDWQAQALLACTVPGLKSREAQALVACGVNDAVDLAELDAVELCDAIGRWGLTEEGQRAWGSAPAPTEDDVATWIERARRVLRQGASAAA